VALRNRATESTPALTHEDKAFASWSAKATPATPSETAAGGKECRRQWGGPEGIGPGSDGKVVAAAKVSLVENRGASTPPEPESPTYTVILKDGSVRADIPSKQTWSTRE
jgi:hypothetical protein